MNQCWPYGQVEFSLSLLLSDNQKSLCPFVVVNKSNALVMACVTTQNQLSYLVTEAIQNSRWNSDAGGIVKSVWHDL